MATKTFDNNGGVGDGKWLTGTNWDPEGIPAAGDDVIIDANCELDVDTPSLASITVNSGTTLTAGGYDITTTGNFVLNGTLTAGASVISVGGHLDWDGAGASFTYGTSKVRMTGTGTLKDNSSTRDFYDLEIAPAGGTTTVYYAYPYVHHQLILGTGTVDLSGTGWISLRGTGTVVSNAGATVNIVLYYRPASAGTVTVAGGTYGEEIWVGLGATDGNDDVDWVLGGDLTCDKLSVFNEKWGDCTFDADDHDITTAGSCTLGNASSRKLTISLGSGTVDVNGDLALDQTGATVTVNFESSTVRVAGDVTVDSSVVVSGGTSKLVLDGSASQSVDLAEKTLNDMEVENTGGTVSFTDGFTASELKLAAGSSIEFSNADTFTITDIDWDGWSGEPITLRSDSDGNQWSLAVSGSQTVRYVDVKDSDASGGSQIDAVNSEDSGNNQNWSFVSAAWQASYYAYDDLDRQTSVVDGEKRVTQYGYDDVGNRVRVLDAKGHATYFHYDEVDRLVSQVDALGNPTYYGYDAVGNRVSVTDPKGQTTYYYYDDVNRLAALRDPEGGVTRHVYDRAGQRLTEAVER